MPIKMQMKRHKQLAIGLLLAMFCPSARAFLQMNNSKHWAPEHTYTREQILAALTHIKSNDELLGYSVGLLVESGTKEAIPVLKEQFEKEEDPDKKAGLAGALVRLGDPDEKGEYWNEVVARATEAVESDQPEAAAVDENGKESPKQPSEAFVKWCAEHHLSLADGAKRELETFPYAISNLGDTEDPRAIPLLRRALQSPIYIVQEQAAFGLARLRDDDSVAAMIALCRKDPPEIAYVIASALVYFDVPEAQAAVDQYMDVKGAKISREARAHGTSPG